MSNSNEKENEKWRKFLQPVITGLVAMMTAFTLYAQNASGAMTDSRMTKIEVKEEVNEKDVREIKDDNEAMKQMLFKIQADVSYIRGKMEKR